MKKDLKIIVFKWCPGADLNHRHEDFQSSALPLSYHYKSTSYQVTNHSGHNSVTQGREKWLHLEKEIAFGRHKFAAGVWAQYQNHSTTNQMQLHGPRSKKQ